MQGFITHLRPLQAKPAIFQKQALPAVPAPLERVLGEPGADEAERQGAQAGQQPRRAETRGEQGQQPAYEEVAGEEGEEENDDDRQAKGGVLRVDVEDACF